MMQVEGLYDAVVTSVGTLIGFLQGISLHWRTVTFSLWDCMIILFVLSAFAALLYNRKDGDK